MYPKISIVTVVYNNSSTIKDALDSVARQTYKDIEYVVIDGGSTDGTLEILQSYVSQGIVSKLISEKDKGIYDAMNKGIELCSGQVIGILNSDDLYAHENVLQSVAQRFAETQCEATYGDLVYVKHDNINKTVRFWKSGQYRPNSFLKGWMPPHPTFFVSKEAYVKYGKYDTRFKISADYELMLRFIHKNKIRIAYIPDVLIQMRQGGVSNKQFKNRVRANYEDRISWRINNVKPRFYTLTAKPLLKIKQYIVGPKFGSSPILNYFF